MTKTVMTSSLLRAALTENEIKAFENGDGESQYFCFHPKDGDPIHVESTATQTMEQLVCAPVESQAKLFQAIANEVPEPGDHMIIINDSHGEKRRTAFVTRLKPEVDEARSFVRLMITR